jgi:hypothetical protein
MIVIFIFLFLSATLATGIDEECLHCICVAESGCTNPGCVLLPDGVTEVCGYYMISADYYNRCGQPGKQPGDSSVSAWKRCSQSYGCATKCVENYLLRSVAFCSNVSNLCEASARVQDGGPYGCRLRSTLPFWYNVESCLPSKTTLTTPKHEHNETVTMHKSSTPYHHSNQSTPDHHSNPSTPDHHSNPSTPDYHSNPSTPDHHSNPSTPDHHSNPSTPDHQSNPSTPDHHSNPSTPDHHSNPSTPDHHSNPSTPDHHSNPSTPEHHNNHVQSYKMPNYRDHFNRQRNQKYKYVRSQQRF